MPFLAWLGQLHSYVAIIYSLHWTWSDGSKLEESCHVITIGAHLSYGYHYVGSGSRIVLTPTTERALTFLVQAVHQGHNTLMNVEEVSVSIDN